MTSLVTVKVKSCTKSVCLHLCPCLSLCVCVCVCVCCRYNTLLQQRARLEGLEKELKEEQEKMALEKEQHRTTASECCRLRDEKDW